MKASSPPVAAPAPAPAPVSMSPAVPAEVALPAVVTSTILAAISATTPPAATVPVTPAAIVPTIPAGPAAMSSAAASDPVLWAVSAAAALPTRAAVAKQVADLQAVEDRLAAARAAALQAAAPRLPAAASLLASLGDAAANATQLAVSARGAARQAHDTLAITPIRLLALARRRARLQALRRCLLQLRRARDSAGRVRTLLQRENFAGAVAASLRGGAAAAEVSLPAAATRWGTQLTDGYALILARADAVCGLAIQAAVGDVHHGATTLAVGSATAMGRPAVGLIPVQHSGKPKQVATQGAAAAAAATLPTQVLPPSTPPTSTSTSASASASMGEFRPSPGFGRALWAFQLLGRTGDLVDKLNKVFVNRVHNGAHDILVSWATSVNKGALPVDADIMKLRELCGLVRDGESFVSCLRDIAHEQLCIMVAYRAFQSWLGIVSRGGPAALAALGGEAFLVTDNVPEDTSDNPEDDNDDGNNSATSSTNNLNGGSGSVGAGLSRQQSSGAVGLSGVVAPPHESEGVRAACSVAQLLLPGIEKSVKPLWVEIQRRIAVMIGFSVLSPAMGSGPVRQESFLQAVAVLRGLALFGRQFASSNSEALDAAAATLCNDFCMQVHRNRLEELATILSNETWRRFPVPLEYAPASVPELGLPANAALPELDWVLVSTATGGGADALPEAFSAGNVKALLDRWQPEKSPFRPGGPPVVPTWDTHLSEGTLPRSANGMDLPDPAVLKWMPPPVVAGCSIAQLRFLGRYMDLMRRLPPDARALCFQQLTQLYDYYLYAVFRMFTLPPAGISPDGSSSISSSAIANTAISAGPNATPPNMAFPASGADVSNPATEALVFNMVLEGRSARLRGVLSRVRDQILGTSPAPSASPSTVPRPGSGNAATTTPASVFPPVPPCALPLDTVHSPVTLYGLSERIVAIQSIVFVASAVLQLTPTLRFLLSVAKRENGKPAGPDPVASWASEVVDAVPELVDVLHVSAAARLIPGLAPNGAVRKLLDGVRWDPAKEVSVHNGYVDSLAKELQGLGARLNALIAAGASASGTATPSNNAQAKSGLSAATTLSVVTEHAAVDVWRGVCSWVFRRLIEGYGKPRNCTTFGRALMMLDLNDLQVAMDPIVPRSLRPMPGFNLAMEFAKV